MAEDLIRYDILAQDALRGVIRKVLSEVAKTGLPGEHHFFISFATQAPGVRISSRLLAQYPQEITIVLQHQYWDLSVTEQAFEVGLSFNGVPERLLVPFTAIKGFLDPSVQFELRFEVIERPVVAEPDEVVSGDGNAPIALVGPKSEKAEIGLKASKSDKAAPAKPAIAAETGSDDEEKPAPAAQVVSLDAFRKK